MHRYLIGQTIFTILRMVIFPATEICAELCCQSTWGHLPHWQLSTKFEPWMKHLSVFDMKQQYILKLILILLRGITLFSTGIISWISCFIVDLVLYVAHAYLSSCFGNSKMVTECEPKPISMNFGSLGGGGGGFMCGRHGAGLDWPEEKDNFSNNILLIFAAIKIWAELCCQSTMEHLS